MGAVPVRSVRIEKAWERLIQKQRGFRLKSIALRGKPPFADGRVDLENGMTVLCGLNGAGKTSLLRLIEGTINGVATIREKCRLDLLDIGEFAIVVHNNGTDTEMLLSTRTGDSSGTRLLDAFELCGRLLTLAQQPNYKDLMEGVEERAYSEKELEEVAYVVGRQYQSVSVFEVEDPDREDSTIPIFFAQSGGIRYGFTHMGLGELAAMAVLWELRKIEAGTVLLLEEPETFLSSRSTAALFDRLADWIHARQLYAVVSTHSAESIARVPPQCFRLMRPSPKGVVLETPTSRASIEAALEMTVGELRLILVEDATAELFIRLLLSQFSGVVGVPVRISRTGGEEPLRAICSKMPDVEDLRMVGVLDGDQTPPRESFWPVMALPGGRDPDAMLREAARGDVGLYSEALGQDSPRVEAALAPIEGLDAHDWFGELANKLGVPQTRPLEAAVKVWLSNAANRLVAEEFVAQLCRHLFG